MILTLLELSDECIQLNSKLLIQQIPDPQPDTVPESSAAAAAAGAGVEPETTADDGKTASDKSPQSYLALTKLGMGKKGSAPKTDAKEKNPPAVKPGKRSITEMASSTLLKAGFTKS